MSIKLDHGLRLPLDPSLNRRDLVRLALDELLSAGFSASRYYELDFGVPDSDRRGFGDRAVLAQTSDVSPGAPAQQLGYAIDWESTALWLEEDGLRVVSDNVDDFVRRFPAALSWATELNLGNRAFVDVPVLLNGRPVGLLAADWDGPASDLSSKHLQDLQILGMAIGSAAEAGYSETKPLTTDARNPRDLIEEACLEIAEQIDAAFAAVFELDWRANHLLKVKEWTYINDKFTVVDICEPPYPIDEGFLTGRAWNKEDYRYVADLERLGQAREGWVNPDSLIAHRRIHGHIPRTVLYEVAGQMERQYLLRFINRSDFPELPFLPRRRKVTASLATQLAAQVDYSIAERRLRALSAIASLAVSNLHNPVPIAKRVEEALADETVDNFCYLALEQDSEVPGFFYKSQKFPDTLTDSCVLRSVKKMRTDGIQGGPIWLEPEREDLGATTARPSGDDAEVALVIKSETDSIAGFLVIPLKTTPPPVSDSRIDHLAPYCDLLTSAVGARSMYISEEGARKALGYIGHEIGTPFTVLGDAAVAVAIEGMRSADRLHDTDPEMQLHMRSVSQRSYSKIQRSRDEIDRVMEIAPILASMGSGSLNMFLTEVDLGERFRNAVERIQTETRGTQPVAAGVRVPARSRKFDIEVLDSIDRLPLIKADSGLIGQVAVNLLRNAIKYSLPRYPPNPMKIRVSGQVVEVSGGAASNYASVTVENWGWGIPADLQGRVFLPFVRGQIEDRLKSLPGMGLGLYLVKTIVSAHGGKSHCRSQSTLDAPREPLFGWITSFEIRIPTDLPGGPTSAEINPYDGRA